MTVVEQPSRALDSPRPLLLFSSREFSNNSLQFRKKIKETVFLTKVHSEECAAMVKIQSTGSSQLSTKDTRVKRGRDRRRSWPLFGKLDSAERVARICRYHPLQRQLAPRRRKRNRGEMLRAPFWLAPLLSASLHTASVLLNKRRSLTVTWPSSGSNVNYSGNEMQHCGDAASLQFWTLTCMRQQ
jgi:hypothetical protein